MLPDKNLALAIIQYIILNDKLPTKIEGYTEDDLVRYIEGLKEEGTIEIINATKIGMPCDDRGAVVEPGIKHIVVNTKQAIEFYGL